MKKYLLVTLRLWQILKPFHKYLYIQLLLLVLLRAISVFQTSLISKVIDKAVSKEWQILITVLIFYLLTLILNQIFNYFYTKSFYHRSFSDIPQYIQEFSLKKIFKLNISQHIEKNHAIRLQIVGRGENAIKSILESLSTQTIPLFFTFLFSIAALAFYSLTIAIISLVTVIIVMVATYKFTAFWRPKMKKNVDQFDAHRKIRTESFSHLKLIKFFGMEKNYLAKYIAKRLAVAEYSVYVWILNLNFSTVRDIFTSLSKYICLILAIYFYAKGNITIGSIYAVFSYLSQMYTQLVRVNQILRDLPLQYIYLEKYLEIIDLTPDFKEEGSEKFQPGNISFENLSFQYPKGVNKVLENISFEIREGEKVALVGYSGSGKTTITQLLLRAYDYQNGGIKISNTELKNLSANNLRENIGYVEQQVDLFDDTLKNNILFGIKDQKLLQQYEENPQLLEEIATQARIDQFYHRLGEKKFETEIGERGVKLSGGERQRVGIARAIIKDPKILIFDEATSALDAENEKYIKEAIDKVSVGRTTIIIAHRLSTVRNADKIFMMSQGKIIAEGTHTELLNTSKEYRDLVKAQLD